MLPASDPHGSPFFHQTNRNTSTALVHHSEPPPNTQTLTLEGRYSHKTLIITNTFFFSDYRTLISVYVVNMLPFVNTFCECVNSNCILCRDTLIWQSEPPLNQTAYPLNQDVFCVVKLMLSKNCENVARKGFDIFSSDTTKSDELISLRHHLFYTRTNVTYINVAKYNIWIQIFTANYLGQQKWYGNKNFNITVKLLLD